MKVKEYSIYWTTEDNFGLDYLQALNSKHAVETAYTCGIIPEDAEILMVAECKQGWKTLANKLRKQSEV